MITNQWLFAFFPQQPSSSSRPPVMHYAVRHNVTANDSFVQVAAILTNITIDGAQPGHVYYIEVTAVNILGPGPPTTTCEIDCTCIIVILTFSIVINDK